MKWLFHDYLKFLSLCTFFIHPLYILDTLSITDRCFGTFSCFLIPFKMCQSTNFHSIRMNLMCFSTLSCPFPPFRITEQTERDVVRKDKEETSRYILTHRYSLNARYQDRKKDNPRAEIHYSSEFEVTICSQCQYVVNAPPSMRRHLIKKHGWPRLEAMAVESR